MDTPPRSDACPMGMTPGVNICAGGKMVPGDITDKQRAIVKAMHDKLVQDGMFFVGIDVIGDKSSRSTPRARAVCRG